MICFLFGSSIYIMDFPWSVGDLDFYYVSRRCRETLRKNDFSRKFHLVK